MRRLVVLFILVLLLPTPAAPAERRLLPRGTKVETFKGGLSFPVDMAWIPGTKKVFFTEKNTGRVRVLVGRRLLGTPCVDLSVASEGEQGALGITLHPRFEETRYLYVMYTNAAPEEMRVTRFKVRNNRCRRPKTIVEGIPASSGYHNGGQLEFAGGKLFVSTGENHSPGEAQSTDNRLGKVLRFNPNGTVPGGNPFGNAVWSYGHRNPFGLAHQPGTKRLFETENGPSCDDELNRIRKGRNYGWGDSYDCGTAGVGANPKGPMKRWTPTVVPTDPWWYRGRMEQLSGSLYLGEYSSGRLHRFFLNDRGTNIKRDRVIFDAASGIVDVSKGPGGWLYFMTSSTIYRIVPN